MYYDKHSSSVFGEDQVDELTLPFTRLRSTYRSVRQASTIMLDQDWVVTRSKIEKHSKEVVRELIDKKAKIIAYQVQLNRSIVFIVRMQQNQQEDLDQLVLRLQHTLNSEQSREHKIATPIQLCSFTDVRQLFLQLEEINFEYANLSEEERSRRYVSVLVTTKIVSMGAEDLQLLDRTFRMMKYQQLLRKSRMRLVVATHHDLSDYNLMRLKCNIAYSELYDPKAVFCRFLLKVLEDEQLMLYPPREALQLVRQFDLYPQVYQEAVRRIIYIANVMNNRKVKFKPVRISNLIYGLMKALTKYDYLSYQMEAKLNERLIFAILDDRYEFKLPGLIVESFHAGEFDENIEAVVARLHEEFRKHPDTAKLINGSCPIGHLRVYTTYLRGRKNDRVSQLEVPKSVEGKYVMLSHQLNKLIKTITADVRSQSKTIPWKEYKFYHRIWPDTTKIIVEGAQNSNLIKVLSHTTKCIEKRHKETLLDSSLDTKYYAFYASVLDYLGLIEFSKKQIYPTYFNQIFARANFRN